MSKAVHVRLVVAGGAAGTASLKLYVHDKMLMDAPAAEAGAREVTLGEGPPTTVSITPDFSVTQVGKTYAEMHKPSMYVSLDVSSSTLTYAGGPVFDVKLGQTVDLELRPKDS